MIKNEGWRMAAVKRAEKSDLEAVFKKYATVERNGEWFMTHTDFVCRYLQLTDSSSNPETIRLLADVADTTKNKLISFAEFRSFESLLCMPDAINQLAFRLFDVESKGRITFENFKQVWSETSIHKSVPFDFESGFTQQYFGQKKEHVLDYFEFSQLLQSLPTEHVRQAFVSQDKDNTGTIPALEFVDLMKTIRGFEMSDHVREHLLTVAGGSPARKVSYAYFKAFNQFLGNLNILERIMQSTTSSDPERKVTQVQLQQEAQQYAQVTPCQVQLLFELSSMEEKTGTISLNDFKRLLPKTPQFERRAVAAPREPADSVEAAPQISTLSRFTLGSLAGAMGATAVHSIDLVKTRLQNQRGTIPGEIMYKNSFDCFLKILRNEGFFGLYRGLLPHMVSMSLEKGIQLTTNDTMRDLLRSKKDGSLALWKESIAGGFVR